MSNKDLTVKRMVNLTAFVGTVLVATALLVKFILTWIGFTTNPGSLIDIIGNVGQLISYLIMVSVAYFYVKTKRKPVWYIVYAISVTVVILLAILNFV